MMSWEICQRAFKLWNERDTIAYWYGAKGEKLTDAVMDYFIHAEPQHFSRYTAEELERLKDWSRGKTGYDCSGFVSVCCGVRGWSSAYLWSHTKNRDTVAAAKAGSLLYRNGHIGIDIGYGQCMMMGREGCTIEIVPNTSQGFTGGGEWADADYSESNSH